MHVCVFLYIFFLFQVFIPCVLTISTHNFKFVSQGFFPFSQYFIIQYISEKQKRQIIAAFIQRYQVFMKMVGDSVSDVYLCEVNISSGW